MTKQEIQQRVFQNGKPLPLSKFTWDEDTKTFSSKESDLTLDFNDMVSCVFNTGSYCVFNTGYGCTFRTSLGCVFNTSFNCTFEAGFDCVFNTGSYCVVVRRDVYEVIELEEGKKIKLNGFGIKGFTYVESDKVEIIIEGKTKTISRKSAIALNLL